MSKNLPGYDAWKTSEPDPPPGDEDHCADCGLYPCRCDEYEDPDDEWACTFCGGEGFGEVDDPLWDDCDEFGIGDCSACGGTGLRKHQTVF